MKTGKGLLLGVAFAVLAVVGMKPAMARAAAVDMIAVNDLPGRGGALAIDIVTDDPAGVNGAVFSLYYPETILEPVATPVTSDFFASADNPLREMWRADSGSTGIIRMAGINMDKSGDETAVLFTVFFRVRQDAPAAPFDVILETTVLCGGPSGWGIDADGDGFYDPSEGDVKESAPVLSRSISREIHLSNDYTREIESETLLATFSPSPRLTFTLADGGGDDQCPDDPMKIEPGICGCGVSDDDANGNGIFDCNEVVNPHDDDQCPNDPGKTVPGICGCGVAETDSDGNNIPDCLQIIISPLNGEIGVSLSPLLEVASPPTGVMPTSPAGIEWQIGAEERFSAPVFMVAGPPDRLSLQAPDFVLEGLTLYYWRIRYFDAGGECGPWMFIGAFTTGADDMADSDGNGIPDSSDIDPGDNRIIKRHPGVNPSDLKMIQAGSKEFQYGLATDSGVVIEKLKWLSSEAIPPGDFPPPAEFPFGLLSFRILVPESGDTAVITVYYSHSVPRAFVWWKYLPYQGWADFSEFTTFDAGRASMTLILTDGGSGDVDGVANGIIVDPGGLAGDREDDGSPCFIANAWRSVVFRSFDYLKSKQSLSYGEKGSSRD